MAQNIFEGRMLHLLKRRDDPPFAQKREFCVGAADGKFWHKVCVQPEAIVGTETAALPTLGVEGQFSAALQTRFRATASACK